jgi:acid phosphatase (class A)
LPPPPTNGSPAALADLETVLQVQAGRTPEQINRAKRVASQSLSSFAQPVLGPWFNPTNFPKTKELFKEIDRESQSIVDGQVKKMWNRTRPYLFSKEVQPIVGRPDNTSYPSGHSAAAALWGTILSAAFPEKADEFKAQIREAMWCRVIGGAHYPSDTVAGAMLGEAIAKAMLQSPEMSQVLEIIRAEAAPFLKSATLETIISPAK